MKKILLVLLISSASIVSLAQPLQHTTWACYNTSSVFFRYYSFSADSLYYGVNLALPTAYSTYSNPADSLFMMDITGPCLGVAGNYTYAIQNDTLLFTTVNDVCGIRMNIWTTYHFVGVVTGVQDPISLQEVSVFPNPSPDGIFNLVYKSAVVAGTTIAVMNSLGEKVFEEQLFNKSVRQSINLQQLPSGTYLLVVQNENTKKVFRITK